MNVAAVVLAAGASTRLGSPKQLVMWEGQPLVRRAASAGLEAGCSLVVVVVGANAPGVSVALDGLEVRLAFNEDWADGMSSSVRVGVSEVAGSDAVLITACDQPRVGADQLRKLLKLFRESGKPIAAAQYRDVLGVPAVFASSIFPSLIALSGDAGARKVINQNAHQVAAIPMPEAEFDIDSPEDLAALIHS